MRKLIIWLLIIVLNASFIYGATVSGIIYDYSLNKVDNVKVEVDSEPKQQIVAKNGSYSFSLSPGEYTIKALKYSDGILGSGTEEKVSIKQEGDYVLDLILFPDFEEEEILLNESIDIEDEYFKEEDDALLYVLIILFLVLIIILIIFISKKKKKEIKEEKEESKEGDESKKIIEFIKNEGGRTTQKDIRKKFPSSEAKISLVIAELESKGKIEKIKKGRGNIIILR